MSIRDRIDPGFTAAYQKREVEWYMRYGKYGTKRVGIDSNGRRYVIGDWSWNRNNPDLYESIECRMDRDIAFVLCKSRPG